VFDPTGNEKLSEHFTLDEMTKSSTAVRLSIDNTPDIQSSYNLKSLCEDVLEPIRVHYNIPFSPSSGYRSKELNKAIGGSPNSQHCEGKAVDFEILGVDNLAVATYVISSGIPFDQLILEYYDADVPNSGWVHISLNYVFIGESKNRQEVLAFDGTSYTSDIPFSP